LIFIISQAKTVDEYIVEVSECQKQSINQLRKIIQEHIPSGFHETTSYGMVGYEVPPSIYPQGYHINPNLGGSFYRNCKSKTFITFSHFGDIFRPLVDSLV